MNYIIYLVNFLNFNLVIVLFRRNFFFLSFHQPHSPGAASKVPPFCDLIFIVYGKDYQGISFYLLPLLSYLSVQLECSSTYLSALKQPIILLCTCNDILHSSDAFEEHCSPLPLTE